MTTTDTVKTIAKYVVGGCVTYTVSSVLKNNTDPEKKRQKAEVYVGSAVIGLMVAEQSERWLNDKIDAIANWSNAKEIETPVS
jgi:hypothetical protein